MASIKASDPSLMDGAPKGRAGRAQLSPAAAARQKQERQFTRLIAKLDDPNKVFEVKPEAGEKAATIRLRLMKVAGTAGREIVVRKHGDGFLVGLMTPERRARQRGRRPGSGRGAGGAD
jgi:hypothetical protein